MPRFPNLARESQREKRLFQPLGQVDFLPDSWGCFGFRRHDQDDGGAALECLFGGRFPLPVVCDFLFVDPHVEALFFEVVGELAGVGVIFLAVADENVAHGVCSWAA